VFGVGQADVGDFVVFPVAAVGFGAVWANAHDFRVTRGKGRIVIPKAFEMGAAVGSHKPAQEDQDNVFPILEISQADGIALEIVQLKIGGYGKNFHGGSPILQAGS